LLLLALYSVTSFFFVFLLLGRADSTLTGSEQRLVVRNALGISPTLGAMRELNVFPNTLIIEPSHGLGNRIRAYASAAALARQTERNLVVVWLPDVHVSSKMSDMFDTASLHVHDVQILDQVKALYPELRVYDYHARGRKDEVIRDLEKGPIYVRSAYILQSQTRVSERDIGKQVRNLSPVEAIINRITHMSSQVATQGNILGVHIRMETNIAADVPGIGELPKDNFASTSFMGDVAYHRGRCHYTAFIPHLLEAVAVDPQVLFLISTDSPDAVVKLREIFGTRITPLEVSEELCSGPARRGMKCLQATLANFYVLSRMSSSLLLSDWSSASELIHRLSGEDIQYNSGCVSHQVPSLVSRLLRPWLIFV